MHPLIIPTFNNPTYLKRFIEQKSLDNFSSLEIYDNNSSFPPMIQLLQEFEKRDNINVHRLESNYGPHYVLRNPEVYNTLPDIFCLSDPDIEFSSTLPRDFLEQLLTISNKYEFGKVGFAIAIPEIDVLETSQVFMDGQLWHVTDWEKQFWSNQIGASEQGDKIFKTTIDTTFALYNKNFFSPSDRYPALRVAGRFTSRHLGFYKNSTIPKEEKNFYDKLSRFSYFSGKQDAKGAPLVELSVLEYTKIIERLESLEKDVTKLALERDLINKNLQSVFGSKSWILTRPLRSFIKMVKGGKRYE